MQYTQVKDLQWADEERTMISCMVNFTNLPEEFVPFGAVAQGDLPHTHEIFARCVAGEFGPIAEYAPIDSGCTPVPFAPPDYVDSSPRVANQGVQNL